MGGYEPEQKVFVAPNMAAQPNQAVEIQEPAPKAWMDQIADSIGGWWVVFPIFIVGLSAVTIFRKAFFKSVKKRVRRWVLDEESSGEIKIKNE